jgi:hypothetical protein
MLTIQECKRRGFAIRRDGEKFQIAPDGVHRKKIHFDLSEKRFTLRKHAARAVSEWLKEHPDQ